MFATSLLIFQIPLSNAQYNRGGKANKNGAYGGRSSSYNNPTPSTSTTSEQNNNNNQQNNNQQTTTTTTIPTQQTTPLNSDATIIPTETQTTTVIIPTPPSLLEEREISKDLTIVITVTGENGIHLRNCIRSIQASISSMKKKPNFEVLILEIGSPSANIFYIKRDTIQMAIDQYSTIPISLLPFHVSDKGMVHVCLFLRFYFFIFFLFLNFILIFRLEIGKWIK